MPKKDDWNDKIQELIDDFPNERYLELLEMMIDLAQTSLDAAREDGRTDE